MIVTTGNQQIKERSGGKSHHIFREQVAEKEPGVVPPFSVGWAGGRECG